MDIKAYLAEQGLSAEEITALVGNEKAAKAMNAALAKYDEGVSLSTRAQTDLEAANAAKVEAEDFWEQKVTPALAGVDKRIAIANAEAAKYKAVLQTYKDQGYDVPGDLLTAPVTTVTPTTPTSFSRDDFQSEMKSFAPTMVTVMSLSNQYQDLYGGPYLTAEEDFAEAQAARKPYREYVKSKYKFEDKQKEKAAAADQARIDKIVTEKVAAEKQKLVEQYGANPETRAPLASKFDKIEKIAERKDSWKTAAGRAESRKNRLAKFENVVQ